MLVVAALVAGASGAWWARSWDVPGNLSPEAGFARDMSRHHDQAVYMSMIAHRHSTYPEVRVLAHQMVMAQQAEIGTMSAWLRGWGADQMSNQPAMAWMRHGPAGSASGGQMPGMASEAEMERLRDARGRALDVLYAQLMIRHHVGGIHMVDGILVDTTRPEVIELATVMKNLQQREVAELRKVLAALGAPETPDA
jgi:uncharacterized protein (DUF305 family)